MKKWIAAIAFLLWVQHIYAQVLIIEGRITYDMYIGNDAENPKGQLIITIKNIHFGSAKNYKLHKQLKQFIIYNY